MPEPPKVPETTNYFEMDNPFSADPADFIANGAFVAAGSVRSINRGINATNETGGISRSDLKNYFQSDMNRSSGTPTSRYAENQFLQIPQFLQYPQDLGTNPRYQHFVVFNIYQGDSDEVRLEKRKVNRVTSALKASGFTENFDGSTASRLAVYEQLEAVGGSTSDFEAFEKALNTVTPGLSGNNIENLVTALGNAVKGVFGFDTPVLNQNGIPVDSFDQLYQTFNDILTSFGDTVEDVGNLISGYNPEIFEEPNNLTPKASGRSVATTYDKSILIANRRYNNANIKSKDTIALYMPLKFSTNDNLVYGEDEMGGVNLLFGVVSQSPGALSAAIERALVRGVADKIGSLVGKITNEDINIGGLRSALRRNAPNPRREMLFKDVALRTHTFDFAFSPKNETEAEMVMNIIKMFRFHAHPTLQDTGGYFFEFPAEFEMTFYTIDSAGGVFVNDNLPSLPKMALTGVAVDYSGAGEFKTFYDAKPAFITLSLTFTEMEQLTSEHIIQGY
jgi:hypothetical protein